MAQGIPTLYRGIKYRSRLEARWAAFMSNIGWEHQYEPFDGDGYIPDFIVYGSRPVFIEVKPAVTIADYCEPEAKVGTGLASYQYDALIVGSSWRVQRIADRWDRPVAGRLHEADGLGWDWGDWFRCLKCSSLSVFHETGFFIGRPCGCYSGDHYLGQPNARFVDASWAEACNDVQWRGRAA